MVRARVSCAGARSRAGRSAMVLAALVGFAGLLLLIAWRSMSRGGAAASDAAQVVDEPPLDDAEHCAGLQVDLAARDPAGERAEMPELPSGNKGRTRFQLETADGRSDAGPTSVSLFTGPVSETSDGLMARGTARALMSRESPLVIDDLEPGSYTLRVMSPRIAGDTQSLAIEVQAGAESRVVATRARP